MHKYFILLLITLLYACSEKEEKTEEMIIVNDPHSYARPTTARVTHLDWEVAVDFDKKQISAIATLSIAVNDEAKQLILDTKGLNIKEVLADGEKANYSVGANDPIMGAPLSIEIAPDTKTVSVEYTTSSEAEALQWLAPAQTADSLGPFLFTQSQAILARSWVPVQDSPGIRFTYNAEVTVPEGMLALMSAENPRTVAYTGEYSFKMEQPIPAYLLALSVGHLSFAPLGARSGVYAEPSVIDRAAFEFEDLEKMILVAEELYGPYRWERYDILVLPPSFPFGGMENPRLTFATPTILAGDKSLTSLVAHELAHSWSGNLVTNATWNDFWLNEGFTVYFEHRIMEKLYGRDYSEMLASLAIDDLKEEVNRMEAEGKAGDTKLKLSLEGRNPDDGVTSIAYDKGYLFLRNIEEAVGRKKFDNFLKNYFDRNAFQVMTTESFLEELDKYLLKNDTAVTIAQAKGWIYKPGIPGSASMPTSDRFAVVERQMQAFLEGKAPEGLATGEWSSHEWLHFIRSLPDNATTEQMKALDETFKFTKSGNSEILAAWLVKAIAHDYKPAYDRLEGFLVNTGRRKFLTPLYSELLKTEEGTEMARKIYKRARPNYHYVATNTIDEMLK